MRKGFQLDGERNLATQDGRQNFFANLDRALGPTMLLAFEAVHIDRKLGWGLNVIEENKTPAFQLGAVGEINVLG